MKSIYAASCAIGLAILFTPPALAVHGTVGTWEIRWEMIGMGAGASGAERFCMNLADVASDKPPMSLRGLCQPQNHSMPGNHFSSEVVCRHPAPGRGTVTITFTSPKHYHGRQNVSFKLGGHLAVNEIRFNAHWVSANCTVDSEGRPR